MQIYKLIKETWGRAKTICQQNNMQILVLFTPEIHFSNIILVYLLNKI